jgi:hypothetical protein
MTPSIRIQMTTSVSPTIIRSFFKFQASQYHGITLADARDDPATLISRHVSATKTISGTEPDQVTHFELTPLKAIRPLEQYSEFMGLFQMLPQNQPPGSRSLICIDQR